MKHTVIRPSSFLLLPFALAFALNAYAVSPAPQLNTGHDRVKTTLKVDLKRIGTIRPRSTDEIRSSNWVIGCETLDRDYADFDEYKRFLKPLGIKYMRLQGGWARCEKEKGKYDFAWLDEKVDYALANGIQPTIETSYGNPIWKDDGVTGFSNRFPCGKALEEGWDNWVRALAKHYKGRVRDWLMWNEPDCDFFQDPLFPKSIAAFNIRTAKIILSEIPDARIGAICSYCYKQEPGFEGADHCFGSTLDCMGADANLFSWFVYHSYSPCPDAAYPHVMYLQKILAARGVPPTKLWQGESGCPSQGSACGALSKTYWTEYSQAKWDMRRMLGDLGHDVRSLVYSMCDLQYAKKDGGTRHNAKGLLRSDSGRKVVAIKRAYYAVQNVVSVFDDTLTRVKEPQFFNVDELLASYEYAKADGRRIYAFWNFASESKLDPRDHGVPDINKKYPRVINYLKPSDSFETAPRVFRMIGAEPLKEPVWVDLFTGGVYAFPAENVLVTSEGVMYLDVPVYDSPCLLAEKSALAIDLL